MAFSHASNASIRGVQPATTLHHKEMLRVPPVNILNTNHIEDGLVHFTYEFRTVNPQNTEIQNVLYIFKTRTLQSDVITSN